MHGKDRGVRADHTCQTSQPPPISHSPAARNRKIARTTLPGVQWKAPSAGTLAACTSTSPASAPAIAACARVDPKFWRRFLIATVFLAPAGSPRGSWLLFLESRGGPRSSIAESKKILPRGLYSDKCCLLAHCLLAARWVLGLKVTLGH